MPSKQNLAVTAATVGGLLVVGGATYAFADGSTPSTAPSSSASSNATPAPGQGGPGQGGPGRPGHQHGKPVNGTITSAVTAAVHAKNAKVTIKSVVQDPRGDYDAFGTLPNGNRVRYEVSKDYKTVTLDQHRGGPGDHQRPWGKPVTGSTLTTVKAKISAKFPKITIDEVRVDGQGTYHALGMKAGKPVEVTVSKDMSKVTERALEPRKGMHRGTPVTGAALTKLTSAITAKYSGVTIREANQEANGTYHAMGTKADGSHVGFTVSKDLSKVTEHDGPAGGPHR